MNTVKNNEISLTIPLLNSKNSKNELFPKYFNNLTILVILISLYNLGNLANLTNFIFEICSPDPTKAFPISSNGKQAKKSIKNHDYTYASNTSFLV